MALNAKHILFVNDYMISQNATESYRKVYECSEEAARKAGSRLLTNVDIKSEIVRRQEAINKKVEEDTGISVQWVLDSFKSIAERCMQAEAVTDREGNPTGEYRFDSSGANKAVENIGKYLGMFKDKGDVPITTTNVNLSGLSLEELRKLAKSKPASA
jgi:phage terminase small subunit